MLVYCKLFMTAFFWGGTFIAGRSIAGTVGPFSAAFIRFTLASACLLFLCWHQEGRLPRVPGKKILPVLLLGMTGVFSYNVCFFKGLQFIEAGRAAVIIANNPIAIALFSAVIFKEQVTPLKLAGILLSVSGAIVVITRGDLLGLVSQGLGWGELFIFGCVGSWVLYSLIGKTVMSELSPLAAVACSAVVGAIALFPAAWHEGLAADVFHYQLWDWLSLVYLGFFGTVLGFVWYYQGIRAIGPSRASLFINFVPVSAVTLAFFILGEPLTGAVALGTVLVCCGVYLTNRPAKPVAVQPARA